MKSIAPMNTQKHQFYKLKSKLSQYIFHSSLEIRHSLHGTYRDAAAGNGAGV